MKSVKYPDGHVTKFMWIKDGYGYIRRSNGKAIGYPLPPDYFPTIPSKKNRKNAAHCAD